MDARDVIRFPTGSGLIAAQVGFLVTGDVPAHTDASHAVEVERR